MSRVIPGVAADAVEREKQAMRRMTESLVEDLSDNVPVEQVTSAVGAAHTRFEGKPIREFVPILVERIVRNELADSDPTVRVPAPTARPAATEQPAEPVAVEEKPAAPSVTRRKLVSLSVGAVGAVAIVAAGMTLWPSSAESPAAAPIGAVTVVRGVVGSEKMSFFADERVVQVLTDNGIRVEVQPAGSRQIATEVNLDSFDFAFPSSKPAAERIQRLRNVTTGYTPFSSPIAIATYRPIADLLTAAGVIKPGPVATFDMQRYLELTAQGVQWDDLPGNTTYPVAKNILVSTTDPRTSNSAAMYMAIAGYVANDHTIVRGGTAEQHVLPTLSKLFLAQGYTDNSSEGPFTQYLTNGMGPTPMVCIYEAQFVEAAGQGRITDDMVLTYPTPTVLSSHTLVPFTDTGDRIGKLLTENAELRRLAAEHGFRTGDNAQFTAVAAERKVPVPADLIDVVDVPAYETLENLLDGVAKSYN
ncbi:three-helix bundle dimerization domain-containing protein [Nocardia sp. NPDC050413]|uniref:three-helix bundle dimerization domain-containing protein n=1 Tax=Nocardia sp. NPDC050413 TaxID=3155784 RepID=UPI0033E145E8